ncbi:MAG: hypothetical protein CHACPFDD_03176 [Phycisphaerae bacterium]|nr:hypothetical protein [Phycisphaerae bacterium]
MLTRAARFRPREIRVATAQSGPRRAIRAAARACPSPDPACPSRDPAIRAATVRERFLSPARESLDRGRSDVRTMRMMVVSQLAHGGLVSDLNGWTRRRLVDRSPRRLDQEDRSPPSLIARRACIPSTRPRAETGQKPVSSGAKPLQPSPDDETRTQPSPDHEGDQGGSPNGGVRPRVASVERTTAPAMKRAPSRAPTVREGFDLSVPSNSPPQPSSTRAPSRAQHAHPAEPRP